jgi:hypothetical protein
VRPVLYNFFGFFPHSSRQRVLSHDDVPHFNSNPNKSREDPTMESFYLNLSQAPLISDWQADKTNK